MRPVHTSVQRNGERFFLVNREGQLRRDEPQEPRACLGQWAKAFGRKILTSRIAVTCVLLILASSAQAGNLYSSHLGRPSNCMLCHPAPADGSALTRAELTELHRIQAEASPERVTLAQEDAAISVFRFADVLGPSFTPEKLPKVAALFAPLDADEWPISDGAKAANSRTPALPAWRPRRSAATGAQSKRQFVSQWSHGLVGTMMGIAPRVDGA